MTIPAVIPDAASGLSAFIADCWTAETHEGNAEATKFPVEFGADITDHVRAQPDKVTLVGTVTKTPIGGGLVASNPVDVPYFVPPLAPTITSLAANISDALFSPPPVFAVYETFLAPLDPVKDAHTLLLAIKNARSLCTVVTSTQEYTDMVLTGVSMSRQEDEQAAEFTLTFEHIITVETATVAAPKPIIPAGKPPVSAGAQGPTPPASPALKDSLALTLGTSGISGLQNVLAGVVP
jgi:hypothetical protein